MKQQLLQLLLSPYVLAGILATLLISFLPNYFSKYKVDLVDIEYISPGAAVFFEDLDGDSRSERIESQFQQAPNIYDASYSIVNSEGDFVDQFNLEKPFCNDRRIIWFKDLNKNGVKELIIPTKSRDTAFLNIREHLFGNNLLQREVFVDTMAEHRNDFEFKIHHTAGFKILNWNDSKFYFSITNGFSGYPRNVYRYDFLSDKLIKSPHLTNPGAIMEIKDIDSDGRNEILLGTNSPGNDIDSSYTRRSDYSTWLTVLDDDLQFLFEPIEFKCLGTIHQISKKLNDSLKIISTFNSKQRSEFPSKLLRVGIDGKIEKEKKLNTKSYKSALFSLMGPNIGLYDFMTGDFYVYDIHLSEIENYKIPKRLVIMIYHDLDMDGQKEWLGIHIGKEKVSIFRNGFKDETVFDLKTSNDRDFVRVGLKQTGNKSNQVFFQTKRTVEIYDYKKNNLYFLRYLSYAGIYGAFLGLFLLVAKGQKNVEAKKRAIEKEILELQLKTIKNQVDPHFVFNAINTISEMTLMHNKLEADKFITRFSGFMRDTLKQSDKISTTLKKELEYTENFIKLQRIRFNNRFDFKIEVDKSVNKKKVVPKHVLFTYVENAIKHGLAHTKNGLIMIKAKQEPDYLFLSIEDNGGGIQDSLKPKKHSTGRGLKIMDKIFDLYTKLYKRKISHNLIELFDESKNKIGICIEIKISNPKK